MFGPPNTSWEGHFRGSIHTSFSKVFGRFWKTRVWRDWYPLITNLPTFGHLCKAVRPLGVALDVVPHCGSLPLQKLDDVFPARPAWFLRNVTYSFRVFFFHQTHRFRNNGKTRRKMKHHEDTNANVDFFCRSFSWGNSFVIVFVAKISCRSFGSTMVCKEWIINAENLQKKVRFKPEKNSPSQAQRMYWVCRERQPK